MIPIPLTPLLVEAAYAIGSLAWDYIKQQAPKILKTVSNFFSKTEISIEGVVETVKKGLADPKKMLNENTKDATLSDTQTALLKKGLNTVAEGISSMSATGNKQEGEPEKTVENTTQFHSQQGKANAEWQKNKADNATTTLKNKVEDVAPEAPSNKDKRQGM